MWSLMLFFSDFSSCFSSSFLSSFLASFLPSQNSLKYFLGTSF